ncbi:MAG: YcaO-like family protein [Pseudomonadota bacterium]
MSPAGWLLEMRVFGEDISAAKAHFDGTHRAISPADTLSWLDPIAKRLGVTRVGKVSGLDIIDVPVWVAIRPNSRGLSASQGKGLTDDAARVSATMESVENWHGENIAAPVRIASHETLSEHHTAISPLLLSHYSDAPPRADMALPWVEGFDLFSQEPCWVPLETVSTDYVVGSDMRLRATFVQSSNGLAGGNHVLEAIEHGLAELIERHVIAHTADRIRAFDPSIRVDPASVQHPACREVLDRLNAAGMQTAIFDLPSELGVPVFAASIIEADTGKRLRVLPPFNGYGCHLDSGIALLRALTEAVQSRVTYITGSRDDISYAEYQRSGNPDEQRSYLNLFAGEAPNAFQHIRQDQDSFEGDIAVFLERLKAVGIESAVAFDLRHATIEVPVTKMVVPGLDAPESLIRGRPVTALKATSKREAA